MVQFERLPLPKNGLGLIDLDDNISEAVNKLLFSSIVQNWSQPTNIKMEMGDPIYVANWIYKSCNPVIKAAPEYTDMQVIPVSFYDRKERQEIVSSFTLSAVGDIGSYQVPEQIDGCIFQEITSNIAHSDFRFANLEAPILLDKQKTTKSTGIVPPKLAIDAATARNVLLISEDRLFNVINLANNHTSDFGKLGLRSTALFLEELDIRTVGLKLPNGKLGFEEIKIKNRNVKWLSLTFASNLTNCASKVVNISRIENEVNLTQILDLVRDEAVKGHEILAISLHWGEEFELFPRPWQIRAARKLADAGADVIIGHHPHVAQPVELFTTSDGNRLVPIAYSLGNVMPPMSHPSSVLSLTLEMKFASAGGVASHRKPKLSALKVTPVVSVLQVKGGQKRFRVCRLQDLAKMDSAKIDMHYVKEIQYYNSLIQGKAASFE